MIDHTQISNMRQLLRALEEQSADRILMKYMEGTEVAQVDAPTFFRGVRRCASMLRRLGLSGKHIGIMGPNKVNWMVHLCAIYEVGSVSVLMAPDLNAQDITSRAIQTDLDAIIYDSSISAVTDAEISLLRISMEEYLSEQESTVSETIAEEAPEDLCCILFTSGTTSQCKAVMLSHRAMIAGICHNVIRFPFEAQLAILPLHHIAGFASVLNTWYLNRIICLGADFKYLYRYLEHMKPDYTLTVPSLLQVILRKLKKGGTHGHLLGWNLHLIGCGGAQFQPDVIQALNDQGIRVLQSYGATEAGGLGFDWEMTPECRDTIGKPCSEIDTKIVDGELFLRSDSVMSGYYKDPEASAEVLIDGWYATGDLCRMDEDGYLRLVGRKKNLIILSNGENVSPEEIESRLSSLETIREVMIGVENDRIVASIYPNMEENCPEESYLALQVSISEAVEAYNRTVPTYKQVHRIHYYREPFAKTAVGKLIRSSVTGVNNT